MVDWKKVVIGISIIGSISAGVYLYLTRRKVYAKPATTEEAMEQFHKRGDINRDGVIDDRDLALVRAAYGSTPGAPNWNPDCDLNGDGRVNMTELVTVSKNYGAVLTLSSSVLFG